MGGSRDGQSHMGGETWSGVSLPAAEMGRLRLGGGGTWPLIHVHPRHLARPGEMCLPHSSGQENAHCPKTVGPVGLSLPTCAGRGCDPSARGLSLLSRPVTPGTIEPSTRVSRGGGTLSYLRGQERPLEGMTRVWILEDRGPHKRILGPEG